MSQHYTEAIDDHYHGVRSTNHMAEIRFCRKCSLCMPLFQTPTVHRAILMTWTFVVIKTYQRQVQNGCIFTITVSQYTTMLQCRCDHGTAVPVCYKNDIASH